MQRATQYPASAIQSISEFHEKIPVGAPIFTVVGTIGVSERYRRRYGVREEIPPSVLSSEEQFMIYNPEHNRHQSLHYSDYNIPSNKYNDNFVFVLETDAENYVASLESYNAAN